jgi:hypothetical protein
MGSRGSHGGELGEGTDEQLLQQCFLQIGPSSGWANRLAPAGRDWRGEGEQREGMGNRGINGELQPPEIACGGWGR